MIAGNGRDVGRLDVDPADDVVVGVGEVHVAVRRHDDAAGRVEPGVDRRAIVARIAFVPAADHGTDRRFAEHERAGAERHDHENEDDGAPQAVDPEHRRRDERGARRPRRHRDHALAERDLLARDVVLVSPGSVVVAGYPGVRR